MKQDFTAPLSEHSGKGKYQSDDHSCNDIKVTGVRCNSPALRGEQFCYFHQNAHRGVRRPKQSRLHPSALIEDEESIQYALMEVMNALMRNTIDLKRATLIIRALHVAVKKAARVKYNAHSRDMVTEIPNMPLRQSIPTTPRPEKPTSPTAHSSRRNRKTRSPNNAASPRKPRNGATARPRPAPPWNAPPRTWPPAQAHVLPKARAQPSPQCSDGHSLS
jgi:hypothetical protein